MAPHFNQIGRNETRTGKRHFAWIETNSFPIAKRALMRRRVD
jgi:hypothetical protein